MGTVYKETFTKPLPAGAKIIVRKGKRLAEWKDAKDKTRTAPLTAAGDRITVEAGTYTAKYRDGSGIVRKVATGCRDESAARSILGKLERRAELVKGEVLTVSEAAVIDHQTRSLADHIADYADHQKAKSVTSRQIADVRSRLNRLAGECGFGRLADLSGTALEKWLAARQADGMGAVTRNAYREAWVTFGNWCVRNRRLLSNPFASVPRADAKADRRRTRRALTETELRRLLDVAYRRPLAEYGRLTARKPTDQAKRKRDTWKMLPLMVDKLDTATDRARARLAKNPELVAAMESLGRERALIYKTLVLTGLRKGELASITVGQVVLDAETPHLILNAADEKNRQGSTIPLRGDLAADLHQWLADKATAFQEAARRTPTVRFDPKDQERRKRNQSDSTGSEGQSCLPLTTLPIKPPSTTEVFGPMLPRDTPLFTVPAGLVRILDRDLRLAGIPKVDERGRTVDVHALRHTFGTLLSKCGVAPRTAQAAMRHSTIDLTMNVYTDPKLLDVAGAVESLPALPIVAKDGQFDSARIDVRATGTDDMTASPLVPVLVPTTGKTCILGSILDKVTAEAGRPRPTETVAASAYPVKQNNPLTRAVNGSPLVEPKGIEPSTSWLQTRRSPD